MNSFDPFIPSYVTLFVITDPLGTATVFLGLTQGSSDDQIRQIARRATLIAFVLLALFGLLGQAFLDALSITLPAFRVAGGLLLFVTAFRMVTGHHEHEGLDTEASGIARRRQQSDIAVFPLAIPLLCGPGCMTASILLFNQPGDWLAKGSVLLAMAAVQITSYLCLRHAHQLRRVIGRTGIDIIARVMAVVLAAMAVQFIITGFQEIRMLVPV